jgi:methyl-accepting chemotaxis protein
MLGHLTDDMGRAQALCGELDADPARGRRLIDTASWLARLSSSYTTLEQKAVHQGKAARSTKANEITFF